MRRRAWLAAAWLAAAVVLPLYAIKVSRAPGYSDFLVYHRAAQRAAAGEWGRIYNLAEDGNSPFRYAPIALPAFRPYGSLPYETARLAWYFTQAALFAAGFWLLYRALRVAAPERAATATAFAFLFSLRFLLDSFMIGQVTGLMFCGLALAALALARGDRARAAIGLLPATVLKIGTGLLYLQVATLRLAAPGPTAGAPTGDAAAVGRVDPWKDRLRAAGLTGAALGALALGTALWTGFEAQPELWRGWWELLFLDSRFFDSSHYGTQSLNSALLRLVSSGMLHSQVASALRWTLTGLGTLGLAALWWLRPARSARGRILQFSLGVLAYLLFMPFTFKYSLPLLAIPVGALALGPIGRLERLALGFGAATLSLAGLDLVGSTVFFALQKASIPCVAIAILAAAVSRQAWKETQA